MALPGEAQRVFWGVRSSGQAPRGGCDTGFVKPHSACVNNLNAIALGERSGLCELSQHK